MSYELPPILLPGRYGVRAGHRKLNGVDLNRIPRLMLRRMLLLDEAFVIGGIRRFVKARCQPEVRQLDMTVLVY